MKYFLITLLLTGSLFNAVAQKFTISGYIKDASSSENLIGANIFDKKTLSGTSSNYYGFYSLTLPSDSVTLIYSYVGYAPQAISFYLRGDTTLHVELKDNALLSEVVISAEEAEKIQEVTQMSTVSVPIEQIKLLPALLGEVDVLKVMQLLPGVQSGNEGSSGLYVRGGGPDQNLILLDGVPVYNAAHLFGFFSVFNSDAINNVQLIKGGFPARYGGRLSSVIDISMKEGNMKEFHGEGAIGLVASKLTLEGPIIKDKTSFIVSGRRTYIDLLARPLIKASTNGEATAGYYFYDLNAKINHKFSNRNRLYLSAYTGDDRAYAFNEDFYVNDNERHDYRDEFGLRWGNITTALRWNYMLNNQLFSNLTLTYSRYRFDVYQQYKENITTPTEEKKENYKAQYLSGIEDWAAKLDLDYVPSPDHYIRFGANTIYHTFSPGAYNVRSNVEVDTTLGAQHEYAVEIAAYAEDDWKISNRLKANAGLHFSGFHVGSTWAALRFYTSLQPRAALRYLLTDDVSVKASYTRMTQYIHLLTNSGIGLPTDLWVPATESIAPQQAHQVALGVAYALPRSFEMSVEGYYKTMQNLIEYKEGASFISLGGNWQDKVETGDGRSYGGELLIQKKEGRTTGWIGYTLSWTNRQFDNLNFGKRFPYKYDRRHDVGVAVVHQWTENKDFSFSWVFGTGNAVSLPSRSYPGLEEGYNYFPGLSFFSEIRDYGDRNSFRMRAYHRLDLSVSFHKKTRWGSRTWTVGVYNVYSRKNPFFMDLSYDAQGRRKFVQYSLFPLIPSINFSFAF